MKVQTDDSGKVEMKIAVGEDGNYRVRLKPVNHLIEGAIEAGLKGGESKRIEKREVSEHKIEYADLGTVKAVDKTLTVVVGGNPTVGVDHLKIEKVD